MSRKPISRKSTPSQTPFQNCDPWEDADDASGNFAAIARKNAQLCNQVAETLAQILSGECHNETLQELAVQQVAPLGNSAQLLVVLSPRDESMRLDEACVNEAVKQAAGWLRAEVAAAVCRRRAPKLIFRFVPGPWQPSVGATDER